ncbi:STAS domain-containing protein [Streptomyces rochei]|uniref:STAS domain-containing protein n=1 Tax=Streptomyces TaxID=1883 RepID=UPI0033E94736
MTLTRRKNTVTASPDTPVVVQPTTDSRTIRLALLGDLDYDSGDAVLHTVRYLLREQPDARSLRLDCQQLGTVDSTGLSVLLLIHRLASQGDISFHLDHIGPTLKRLLDITGTYEHLSTPQPAAPVTEPVTEASSEP